SHDQTTDLRCGRRSLRRVILFGRTEIDALMIGLGSARRAGGGKALLHDRRERCGERANRFSFVALARAMGDQRDLRSTPCEGAFFLKIKSTKLFVAGGRAASPPEPR